MAFTALTDTDPRRAALATKKLVADSAPSLMHFDVARCSLGHVLVAATSRGICAILLGDSPEALARELAGHFPRAGRIRNASEVANFLAQVVASIEAPESGLDAPLDVRGTEFQQRVWQALREIPRGGTASYAQIAERLGAPRAVRAVARACASNAIAIAIPCHRVVRSDGALSGYRWGVHRKRALLRREKTHA